MLPFALADLEPVFIILCHEIRIVTQCYTMLCYSARVLCSFDTVFKLDHNCEHH